MFSEHLLPHLQMHGALSCLCYARGTCCNLCVCMVGCIAPAWRGTFHAVNTHMWTAKRTALTCQTR